MRHAARAVLLPIGQSFDGLQVRMDVGGKTHEGQLTNTKANHEDADSYGTLLHWRLTGADSTHAPVKLRTFGQWLLEVPPPGMQVKCGKPFDLYFVLTDAFGVPFEVGALTCGIERDLACMLFFFVWHLLRRTKPPSQLA